MSIDMDAMEASSRHFPVAQLHVQAFYTFASSGSVANDVDGDDDRPGLSAFFTSGTSFSLLYYSHPMVMFNEQMFHKDENSPQPTCLSKQLFWAFDILRITLRGVDVRPSLFQPRESLTLDTQHDLKSKEPMYRVLDIIITREYSTLAIVNEDDDDDEGDEDDEDAFHGDNSSTYRGRHTTSTSGRLTRSQSAASETNSVEDNEEEDETEPSRRRRE
ncbi:hypothetical protein BC629DRAFT_1438849 [Irpex lacteus]|nr:hypothetical protein BC629DRAFT_1438849 [Irpex lacteus]